MKKSLILIILFNCFILISAKIPEPIAITSFKNLTDDKEYEWFNEALANMLSTDLSSTNKISLVNRLSLKKILNEQRLSLSGTIDKTTSVKIGNLVGAKSIISGSFMVSNGDVRLDTQIYSVETGILLSATKVNGKIENIFSLEEKLAIKLLEILSVKLTDKQKSDLFKKESDNIEAVKRNYKGVIAEDNNKLELAIKFYKEAIHKDPNYEKANRNLRRLSKKINGKELFNSALSDLQNKEEQLKKLKSISREFKASFYNFYITDDIDIVTNPKEDNYVDVIIKFNINLNYKAINKYLNSLDLISEGNNKILFKVKLSENKKNILGRVKNFISNSNSKKPNNKIYTLFLFKNSYDWVEKNLKDKKFVEYSTDNLWFNKKIDVILQSSGSTVKRKTLYISINQERAYGHPYTYMINFVNPVINCLDKNSWGKFISISSSKQPCQVTVTFTKMNIDEVRSIDNVEIVAK